MRPNYASELFTKFIKDNGLPPLTLHGLRHSFASIASAKGIPLYGIGRALGHSSPSTTRKITAKYGRMKALGLVLHKSRLARV